MDKLDLKILIIEKDALELNRKIKWLNNAGFSNIITDCDYNAPVDILITDNDHIFNNCKPRLSFQSSCSMDVLISNIEQWFNYWNNMNR